MTGFGLDLAATQDRKAMCITDVSSLGITGAFGDVISNREKDGDSQYEDEDISHGYIPLSLRSN